MLERKSVEREIMHEIMKEAPKYGARLFRNQVGKVKDARSGNWISYGIPGPGGSDLIGFREVKITQEMVGKTVPVFTAVEVKTKRGTPTSDQLHFIEFITGYGGFAGICRSVEELNGLLSLQRLQE